MSSPHALEKRRAVSNKFRALSARPWGAAFKEE
jgi:hypothetical protein